MSRSFLKKSIASLPAATNQGIQPDLLSTTAKNFYVKTLSGRVIQINFEKAREHHEYIILHFWGTWCVPCRNDFPAFLEFAKRNQSPNLSIAAISWMEKGETEEEKLQNIRSFINKLNYNPKEGPPPVYFFLGDDNLGTETAKHYGLGRFPLTIFIDSEGKIVKRITGITDWNSDEMKSLITQFISGKLPPLKPGTIFDD